MNVMQTLTDFKQNLRSQSHPSTVSAAAAKMGTQATPGGATAGTMIAAKAAASAPQAAAAPATTSTTGTATITANDFLQLLVAEMKNQDPTANQDPNAYIDQLVQVNSLQQLISINQNTTPATSTATGGAQPGKPASGQIAGSSGALGSAVGTPAESVATALAAHPPTPEQAAAVQAQRSGQNPALNLGLGSTASGAQAGAGAGAQDPSLLPPDGKAQGKSRWWR